MTTGKPCESDADCKGTSGPGTNVCSIDYTFIVNGVKAQLWPTPLCLPRLPTTANSGSCDPAPPYDPTGSSIHFCDGPDDPGSPGICIPNNTAAPVSGQGVCLPKCTFATDGSPATGCPGKDTCAPYTFVLPPGDAGAPAPPPVGYGFCQGSCQQDSDCTAAPPKGLGPGYSCQLDIGFCTKTPVVRAVDAGAAIGDGCRSPATGQSTACFCAANSTTQAGYCTSACVVGGAACPSGYTCDNGFGGTLSFGDAGTYSYSKQTVGSVGTCYASCTHIDSGVGCPPNSTCGSSTLAGPDCIP
jgi:hypothetical protein